MENSFVVRFNGTDVPGLVYAIANELYKDGYNVSDISLSTGSGVHTTFLTCRRTGREAEKPMSIPREKIAIRDKLLDALRRLYRQHYDDQQQVYPPDGKDWDFDIYPAGDKPPLQLYLEIDFLDKRGAVANLTDLLRDVFTISDAFDRPSERDRDTQEHRRCLFMRIAMIEEEPPRSAGIARACQEEDRPRSASSARAPQVASIIEALKDAADKVAEVAEEGKRGEAARGLEKALERAFEQWIDISTQWERGSKEEDAATSQGVLVRRYKAAIKVGQVLWRDVVIHEWPSAKKASRKHGGATTRRSP